MSAPDASDHNQTEPTPEAATPQAERNGLRAALAAARGTILDLRSHLADLRAAQDFLRLSREAAAAEARDLRARFAAAEAELRAREDLMLELRSHHDALLAERNWLRGVRDAHEARLRELEPLVRQVTALTEERNALSRQTVSLNRLVRDLRWEDGPRSVRAVLPLSRLIRRVNGG